VARPKTIRELLVAVGVKADTKALTRFDRQLVQVKAGMATAARGAFLFTAALVGTTAALFKIAQATATAGDNAAKTGKRIGLTAAEVQELSFAAEISGASVTDLEAGMRRLTKTASDADRGLKTATDAFGDLGIEVNTAAGELKAPLVLFEEVAEELSQVTNDTKRAALAAEIFGRGGARLIPLLSEGADGIAELRKEAQELGFVFDAEAAAAAEEFIDSQTRLRKTLEGVRNTIGVALLPVFNDMIDGFVTWFKANRDVIKQRVEKTALDIAAAFRTVGQVLVRVDRFVQDRIGGWGRVLTGVLTVIGLLVGLKGFAGVVTIVQALVAAFSIMAGLGIAVMAQIAAAVAIVVIGFGLLFLAVDDLVVFLRGGESVLGAFLERFGDSRDAGESVRRVMAALRSVGEALEPVLARIGATLSKLLAPALAAIVPLLQGFFVGFAKDKASEILDFFEGLAIILEFIADLLVKLERLQELATFETVGEAIQVVARGRGALADTRASRAARGFAAGTAGGAVSELIGAGLARIAAPPGGGGTVNVQGDTITIDASAMTPEELREVLEERDREKRRATAAALAGGDV
jgi:hypothetical protein